MAHILPAPAALASRNTGRRTRFLRLTYEIPAKRQQTTGVSEGRFPDGGTNILALPGTASPGASNWRLLENIVIDEVLTHTDLPLEDAIELRNAAPTASSPMTRPTGWRTRPRPAR